MPVRRRACRRPRPVSFMGKSSASRSRFGPPGHRKHRAETSGLPGGLQKSVQEARFTNGQSTSVLEVKASCGPFPSVEFLDCTRCSVTNWYKGRTAFLTVTAKHQGLTTVWAAVSHCWDSESLYRPPAGVATGGDVKWQLVEKVEACLLWWLR